MLRRSSLTSSITNDWTARDAMVLSTCSAVPWRVSVRFAVAGFRHMMASIGRVTTSGTGLAFSSVTRFSSSSRTLSWTETMLNEQAMVQARDRYVTTEKSVGRPFTASM